MKILRKARLENELNKMIRAMEFGNLDAWQYTHKIEKFIVHHKKDLVKHPLLMRAVEKEYKKILRAFSNNLGQISHNLFDNLDDLGNIHVDSRSPASHQDCVNASDQIAMRVIDEVLSMRDIEERTIVVWRYIVIAKMRLDDGDYQGAEFIVSALLSPAVSPDRLKATYAGLPRDAVDLIKSMERIVIKPDSHVMTFRTKPVIPSLARIKKLMTFASSESVSDHQKKNIQEMITNIQNEVRHSDKPNSDLAFFDYEEVKSCPYVTLDEFNKEKYLLSVRKIEKRGEVTAEANLFKDKFKLLPAINMKIDIDNKINTFLRVKANHEKLIKVYNDITELTDELLNLAEYQPNNKNGRVRKNILQEINAKLDKTRECAKLNSEIKNCDKTRQYLEVQIDDEVIKNYQLNKGFKRWRESYTLANKLEQLIDLLQAAKRYQKNNAILEKRYAKLEKQYKELSVYQADLSSNLNLNVEDQEQCVQPQVDDAALNVVDLNPTLTTESDHVIFDQALSRADSTLKILEAFNTDNALQNSQTDASPQDEDNMIKHRYISEGLRSLVSLYEYQAINNLTTAHESIKLVSVKSVRPLIRLFDQPTVEQPQSDTIMNENTPVLQTI